MGIYDLTGNTVKADGFVGTVSNPAVTALVELTNNSGGTANDTIQAMPALTSTAIVLSTAGGNTYTDAAVKSAVDGGLSVLTTKIDTLATEARNNVADLTVKINAIIAALKA